MKANMDRTEQMYIGEQQGNILIKPQNTFNYLGLNIRSYVNVTEEVTSTKLEYGTRS